MGEFNSDDHYIYYCGQESLRRNGVALIVNKRVQNAVLGCNLKNDRMISVRFQGKPFNITVIQAYAPTSNAEEAEVKWFYEDLQLILELTAKKDVLFIIGDWNEKVGSQETPGVIGKFGLGIWNEALGCNLKNDRMISVHFQGKPFTITVIQVYAPTTADAEEAEVEQLYEDLQDLLELTHKKDVLLGD